jgi:hypothetical protein
VRLTRETLTADERSVNCLSVSATRALGTAYAARLILSFKLTVLVTSPLNSFICLATNKSNPGDSRHALLHELMLSHNVIDLKISFVDR